MKAINLRDRERVSYEGKLHGMEVKLPPENGENEPEINELPDDSRDAVAKHLAARQAEKKREMNLGR